MQLLQQLRRFMRPPYPSWFCEVGIVTRDDIRPGEVVAEVQPREDAHVHFIGRIRTPFFTRGECPRQGAQDGPECILELDAEWLPALEGIEAYDQLDPLYWLDQAARDFLLQTPKGRGKPMGTFALRSPNRPNPIGTSIVRLDRISGRKIYVRGLDCIDGTPLLDIKPYRGETLPKIPHLDFGS